MGRRVPGRVLHLESGNVGSGWGPWVFLYSSIFPFSKVRGIIIVTNCHAKCRGFKLCLNSPLQGDIRWSSQTWEPAVYRALVWPLEGRGGMASKVPSTDSATGDAEGLHRTHAFAPAETPGGMSGIPRSCYFFLAVWKRTSENFRSLWEPGQVHYQAGITGQGDEEQTGRRDPKASWFQQRPPRHVRPHRMLPTLDSHGAGGLPSGPHCVQ